MSVTQSKHRVVPFVVLVILFGCMLHKCNAPCFTSSRWEVWSIRASHHNGRTGTKKVTES
uniref:Uncharacterized protein n=1 Tax=Anopheles minimus TaxID=112268 RepID=A0A182WQA7_9DIPT